MNDIINAVIAGLNTEVSTTTKIPEKAYNEVIDNNQKTALSARERKHKEMLRNKSIKALSILLNIAENIFQAYELIHDIIGLMTNLFHLIISINIKN